MTSKQRAALRSLSNNDKPLVLIGKDGLTDEVITSVRNALNTRELIKFKVLKNSDVSAKECMQELCEKINAEAVSVVGNVGVIYKLSQKKKTHIMDEIEPKKDIKKGPSTGHKPGYKAKIKREKEREEEKQKQEYIRAKIKESKGEYVAHKVAKPKSMKAGSKKTTGKTTEKGFNARGNKSSAKSTTKGLKPAGKTSRTIGKTNSRANTRTGKSSVISRVQKSLKGRK